jgi:hypothetical protein
MTLYGLPMLRVDMPVTSTQPADGPSLFEFAAPASADASSLLTSTVNLTFTYAAVTTTVPVTSTYFTLVGDAQAEVQASGGRPLQPLTSRDIQVDGYLAHGALMTGGAFTDLANVDIAITRIVTDDVYAQTEPLFPSGAWFPAGLGAVNRFLSADGSSYARLVVTPGQFKAADDVTGTERLYDNLQFEIYQSPITNTNFVAPSIWQVTGTMYVTTNALDFTVRVTDDANAVQRVVVLYRVISDTVWSKAELPYNAGTQAATISLPGVTGEVEFFAQAVDSSGNVALALNHGNPYIAATVTTFNVYLPLVRK